MNKKLEGRARMNKKLERIRAYHRAEAERIQGELDRLDEDDFPEGGIVRTILTERVAQERKRSLTARPGHDVT